MNKSKKVASLFLVAALALGTGCSTDDAYDENCPDEDQDGICDDEEEDGGSGYSKKKKSGISSGSKGGIGSSGWFSGS